MAKGRNELFDNHGIYLQYLADIALALPGLVGNEPNFTNFSVGTESVKLVAYKKSGLKWCSVIIKQEVRVR